MAGVPVEDFCSAQISTTSPTDIQTATNKTHAGDGKTTKAEIRNFGKTRINAVSSFLPRSLPHVRMASIIHRYPVRGDYVAEEVGSPVQGLHVQVDRHQKDVLSNAHTTYYAYLRTAIAAARDELGEELTRWRDVVGREEMGEGARRTTAIVLGHHTAMPIPGRRILGTRPLLSHIIHESCYGYDSIAFCLPPMVFDAPPIGPRREQGRRMRTKDGKCERMRASLQGAATQSNVSAINISFHRVMLSRPQQKTKEVEREETLQMHGVNQMDDCLTLDVVIPNSTHHHGTAIPPQEYSGTGTNTMGAGGNIMGQHPQGEMMNEGDTGPLVQIWRRRLGWVIMSVERPTPETNPTDPGIPSPEKSSASLGSSSLKAQGIQKEEEAKAVKVQSSELAEVERLEAEAPMRRERAVAQGAHPDNRYFGSSNMPGETQ
ncbi:hypothetical protein C8J56DRAFT_1075752 [Mycena floridula]|nr:hypothetical protein C8J56DRAFT_1075752 [Mycena floridula]